MKSPRFSYTCVLVVAFMCLYACRPLYIPNTVHVPMLTEKNEINAAVVAGSAGIDGEFAWSPGKHWGILMDGSYFDNTGKDTLANHKHWFLEAGAGYHTQFGIGRFDVYGGGGYGFALTTNDTTALFGGTSEGNYTRLFVQPSIGLGTDIVDVNFALRTAWVGFSNVKTTHFDLENKNSFFLEPALTVRAGYKWIKFFVQAGFSLPLQKELDVQHQPFIIMTGVNLNFFKWKYETE